MIPLVLYRNLKTLAKIYVSYHKNITLTVTNNLKLLFTTLT